MNRYEIILKPQAIKDLDSLQKRDAVTIADRIERHLRHKPAFISKSRIKKLRGIQEADYRLRVGDYRVFYSVDELEQIVYVLRVLHKRETSKFYR